MVGAINAPLSGNTFEAFIALSQNSSASTSPSGSAIGGVLKMESNSTNSSALSSGAAATHAAFSMAALSITGALLVI